MGDLTDRRTLLRSGVAGCVAGLAGCLGVLDDGLDDGPDDERDQITSLASSQDAVTTR